MIQADTCYVPRGPHRGKVGGQQAKESTHAKRHRAAGDTQRFDSTDPEAVFQYMRELSRLQLLSREEEISFARQIAGCVAAGCRQVCAAILCSIMPLLS